MISYPMMVHLQGKKVVVVGGGRIALRKVRGLLPCGAQLTIVAPELIAELQQMIAGQDVTWHKKYFAPADVAEAFIVIAATNHAAVNLAVYEAAQQKLVNIADRPDLCNFFVPAFVRSGLLTVTVSTEGASPALSRRMRRQFAEQFDESYAAYLQFLQHTRQLVLTTIDDATVRLSLLTELASDSFFQRGDWEREFTRLYELARYQQV